MKMSEFFGSTSSGSGWVDLFSALDCRMLVAVAIGAGSELSGLGDYFRLVEGTLGKPSPEFPPHTAADENWARPVKTTHLLL